MKKDDIAVIKPGEKIPADGLVVDGSSYVNESVLTGESVSVKKENKLYDSLRRLPTITAILYFFIISGLSREYY